MAGDRELHGRGAVSGRGGAICNTNPAIEWETRAKNLLKAEVKRKGITYAGLAEALKGLDIHATERNLNNKISRGGFTAAFLLQCLAAIGVTSLHLDA